MSSIFKKIIVFIFAFFILFIKNVYANSYAISLLTNSNNTIKKGEIVEIRAGIACASDEDPISQQKFTLIYDKDVFELQKYDDGKYFKLRNGWQEIGYSGYDGQYDTEIGASSSKNYITENEASANCADSKNVDLITYKLKVKDVKNQTTKVQIINDISYVKDLKFTIYNKSSNNYLSSIRVDNFELDSDFNKNKNNYEIYVPYSTEKVNVTAATDSNTSKLSGTGEKELTVGSNKVNLTVTAEDGSKNIYVIDIIRKDANNDTDISKITITDSNKKTVKLSYDESKKTYTGTVSSDISFVYFDIKCSGEECLVDELNPELVKEGENIFKFKVTSQNGDKKQYKIVIKKDKAPVDNSILYLTISLVISILLCIFLLILYIKSKRKIRRV